MSEETIPQMREQIESLTKDLTKVKDESVSLAKENRTLKARDIAREQGYDASRGDLFASANPDADITAEALDQFVQNFNLGSAPSGDEVKDEGAPSGEGDPPTGEPAGSGDLANMARGGSRPGDSAGGASPEKMTRQEWQELHANDPIAAREAVRQGQVEISSGNPFGDGRAVAVGANPYNKSA
jgi:hypothetical protein